jgi:hypothetical protein
MAAETSLTKRLVCTCGWAGSGWRSAKDHVVEVAGAHEVTEATEVIETPDWRCGCGPNTTRIECPYHGDAL